jgi:hypothetical protein
MADRKRGASKKAGSETPPKKATPSLKSISKGAAAARVGPREPIIYSSALAIHDMEIVWVEKYEGEDAYIWPLVEFFKPSNDEEGRKAALESTIAKVGITNCFVRRQSLDQNVAACQASNAKYFRRIFFRFVPSGASSTPKTRLVLMNAVKEVSSFLDKHCCHSILMIAYYVASMFAQFFDSPVNNRFGTVYKITNESDITPSQDADLPALDVWIQNTDIAYIMENYFNELDTTWAAKYPATAAKFFSHVPPPLVAIERFGYTVDT